MSRLHHLTTMIPVGIEAQLETLESWHKAHGQKIYALNHSREYAVVKDQLPDWIVPVEVRFAQKLGRDYLPFVALFAATQALGAAPDDRFLLVNSDIGLADPEALAALQAVDADMVFASRNDIGARGRSEGIFHLGYDVFLLRPEAATVLDLSEFYLGIPWWDYFLPMWTLANGFRVERFDSEAFTHIVHPQRWSQVSFYHGGWTAMRLLLPEGAPDLPPEQLTVNAFAKTTNEFLNSPLMAARGDASQEKIWAAYLARLAEAWDVELPAAPARGLGRPRGPVLPLALSAAEAPPARPASDAPADPGARLLVVAPFGGDAPAWFQNKAAALRDDPLSPPAARAVVPEACEVQATAQALTDDPALSVLVVCQAPEDGMARSMSAQADISAALAAWTAAADAALDLLDRFEGRAWAVSARGLRAAPARVLAACAAGGDRGAAPLSAEPQPDTDSAGPAPLARELARAAIAAAGGTEGRAARLAGADLLANGADGTSAEAEADWGGMFAALEERRSYREGLERRIQVLQSDAGLHRPSLGPATPEPLPTFAQRLKRALKVLLGRSQG